MKRSATYTILALSLAMLPLGSSLSIAGPTTTAFLTHKLTVTPELKKTFEGSDAIEIREITGTADKFQVGGTYRLVGVCRQETYQTATLYIGNSSEPGAAAIVAHDGSSLFKTCGNGLTEFDVTFTLLRPGILHATIYDTNRTNKTNNSYAGIVLGDVVFKH